MRTIITGSKGIEDIRVVKQAVAASRFAIDEVVSGTGRGVNHLGEQWARQKGLRVKQIPADTRRHGERAGTERDYEMIRRADAMIVVWDGENQQTLKLINRARRRGLKVHIHRLGR